MLLVSFNAHMCVGDQDWFVPRATMAIVPGDQAAQKAHFFFLPAANGAGALPFAAPPAAFAAAGWAASSSSPCPYASSLQPPSPPLSPLPSAAAAAAAAAATAAARASFLAVSRSMISFRVSVGANSDGAGPSGLLRSFTYRTRTSWRSVCHVSSDSHQTCIRGPT
jgi:hypothetical protein